MIDIIKMIISSIVISKPCRHTSYRKKTFHSLY